MSSSTSLEELAASGRLDNIRVRYAADGTPRYEVRVHPRSRVLEDILDAIRLARDWLAEREQAGPLTRREPIRRERRTLAEWADELYLDKQTPNARRHRDLSDDGLAFWRRSLRPWRGDVDEQGRRDLGPVVVARDRRQVAFAELCSDELDEVEVDVWLRRRMSSHRVSARNEQQALVATLKLAQARGATVPPALLALEPIVIEKRSEEEADALVLELDELDFLAARAAEHSRRAITLMGTVAFRIGELLLVEDERVNLTAEPIEYRWRGRRRTRLVVIEPYSIFIPAEHCKERRDKVVPLLADEARLVHEQMMVRAAGATRLFPRKGGTPWTGRHFADKVWAPAKAQARADWQAAHRGRATPFDELTLHALRHTGITLMRRAGLDPALVAARVGHNDDGKLVEGLYAHRRRELRGALGRLGPSLRAALGTAVGSGAEVADSAPGPTAVPLLKHDEAGR